MPRELLPDYKVDVHSVQRSYIDLPSGKCVLLKKDKPLLQEKFQGTDSLKQFLSGSKDYPPGIVVSSGMGEWTQAKGHEFNCHSLSVGPFIGLSSCDWLEGLSCGLTENQNPLQILLNEYFEKIGESSAESAESYLLSSEFQNNDVVVLRGEVSGHDYFVHSGRVQWVDGYPYLLSKFGENSILLTPPFHFIEEYREDIYGLEVYRFKSS